MDRKVNGRNIAASLVMLAALLVTVSASSAKSLPSQAAWQANAHQLGNRVLKAIHRVEKSDLDCQIRNLLVHRLRLLHDAITSGRGTAARGFLIAWLHNVRTMQGAQLLTAEEGSALQVALMDMLEQVGEGWPKNPMPTRNWPKLPACDAASDEAFALESASEISDANVAVSSVAEESNDVSIFEWNDAQYIVRALVAEVPGIGKILAPIVQILWPSSGGPDIYELIDETLEEAARNDARNALTEMQRTLDNFLWVEVNTPSQASEFFAAAQTAIYAGLGIFQWDYTDVGGEDYRVEFLPLFAQGENLYLALLREAALHGTEWGWSAEDVEKWKGRMKEELDPNDKTKGLGYAMDIYNLGLSQKPTGMDQSSWTTRNKYVRENTIGALDYVEIWKYMDPYEYPNGVPNLKLTRMIYSDPIGVTDHTFTVPPYAYGPLRNLTVWVDTNGDPNPFIDAMQQTGGPTAGPFTTGPVMGDTSHDSSPTRYDYDILPGNTLGPIVSVDGYSAMDWVKQPAGIDPEVLYGLSFTFASGGSSGLLGSHPDTFYGTPTNPGVWTVSEYHFSYPGEVVASVQVMGDYLFYTRQHGADSVVFGFRYADSYYPSGYLINSFTKDCMKPSLEGHVTLGICLENIWTYNLAFRQLSTLGRCLDTNDDGEAILNDCKDVPTQRWDIIPSGVGGTIGRDGQVLTPSQSIPPILELAVDTNADNQRWITPNHVQGPVHSVAAGMCLGNISSPAEGTYMQIYPCASGYKPGQTWTYSPSMGTLSLEAGTMCLDAPGDPGPGTFVQVNDCNADDSQQWILEPDTSRIQHVNSGLYLDLYGGIAKSLTPVVLGDGTDTYSQKWTWPMY